MENEFGFDYKSSSKYECSLFDAGYKAEIRKTQFPADLAKAFEMGKTIAFSRFEV